MTPILARTLARERRKAVGWIAGVVLLVLVTTGSWPGIESASSDMQSVMDNLPAALTAFFGDGIASFSAAGIVGSRLYGTIGLALFIAYGVSRGARAIAGEEETGTLELLVVQPISRTAVAVDRVLAMLIGLLALVALEAGLLLGMMPVVGLDFDLAHVAGAAVGLYLLSAMFGALAFAAGALGAGRSAAVGIAGGLAGALFILTGLSGLVDGLEWFRDVSPFGRYDGTVVLSSGLDVPTAVAFALITAVLLVVGVKGFGRRDLS